MIYTYRITKDESGSFEALVLDAAGVTVYKIDELDLAVFMEEGVMSDKNDVTGLAKHLVKDKVMGGDDGLEVEASAQ